MENVSVLEKVSDPLSAPESASERISSLLRTFQGERFQSSVIGVMAACIFLWLATYQVRHMEILIGPYGPVGSEFYAAAASTLSKFLFLSMMIVLFVVRKPPVKKAKGLLPRLAALVGSFMIASVALLPETNPTLMQGIVGLSLVCVGSLLSVYVINFLGRSFSLMAEARELVTKGPYSIVRHPLYLVEEIAVLGVVVQVFSLPALAIFFAHIAVQIQRMRNEEKVLTEAFPDDYKAYKIHTSRLIPGIY